MYCPNCGIEIHLEGSYCAKCQKSTAYLTQKRLVNFIVPAAPPENSSVSDVSPNPLEDMEDAPDQAADTPKETASENAGESAAPAPVLVVPASPKEEGFYCNFCGTFIYEEDNYCYSCGKATRKQYYKASPLKKKKKLMLGIGTASIFILFIIIGYLLYR